MNKYLLYGMIFFLISPGVLITIPPKDGKIFMSQETSIISVLMHMILFILLIYIIDKLMDNIEEYKKRN